MEGCTKKIREGCVWSLARKREELFSSWWQVNRATSRHFLSCSLCCHVEPISREPEVLFLKQPLHVRQQKSWKLNWLVWRVKKKSRKHRHTSQCVEDFLGPVTTCNSSTLQQFLSWTVKNVHQEKLIKFLFCHLLLGPRYRAAFLSRRECNVLQPKEASSAASP